MPAQFGTFNYYRSALPALALALGLAACSGGGRPPAANSATPTAPPTSTPITPPPVLAGAPTALALQSFVSVKVPPVASADISADGLLLNRINVFFAPTATVADVNAVANAIQGTIAYSRLNSPMVEFAIPRQTGRDALLTLASQLEQRTGVVSASTSSTLQPNELPRDSLGGLVNSEDYQQLLAARFPAAWNAKALLAGCEARPVTILVTDHFAVAAPAAFDAKIPPTSFVKDPDLPLLASLTSPSTHGYFVTELMAGSHDGTLPPGAHPDVRCLRIEQMAMNGLSKSDALDKLVNRLARNTENVIVQSSLGFQNGFSPSDSLSALGAEEVVRRAKDNLKATLWATVRWAELGLAPATNSNTLIFQASGNSRDDAISARYTGFSDARVASNVYAAARALPNIRQYYGESGLGLQLWSPVSSATGPTLAPVQLPETYLSVVQTYFDNLNKTSLASAPNAVTVGATMTRRFDQTYPQSDFSNDNPDLHAVGEQLKLNAPNANGEDLHKGTSYSTPIVSGLAAYLWQLSDELRSKEVGETAKLLAATAQVGKGTKGFVDAYAAVLALDRPGGAQRVRRAILDANNDGRFDDADINLYLAAMERPTTRDYSRFDLNGDGFTQSGMALPARTAPMDLDAALYGTDGTPTLQQLQFDVDEFQGTVNEGSVTDIQALCYFAYSKSPELYSGTKSARTAALGPTRCADQVDMGVIFPLSFSGPANLTVDVTRKDAQGVSQPVVGALIEVEATCAQVSPSTGQANSVGAFTATVTAGTGCTRVLLQITARDPTTNAKVAQRQVSATVDTTSTPVKVVGGTITINKVETTQIPTTSTFSGSINQSATVTLSYATDQQGSLFQDGVSASGSSLRVARSVSNPGNCPSTVIMTTTIAGTYDRTVPQNPVVGPNDALEFDIKDLYVSGPGTETIKVESPCANSEPPAVEVRQQTSGMDMSIPGTFKGLTGSTSGTIDTGTYTYAYTVTWSFQVR